MYELAAPRWNSWRGEASSLADPCGIFAFSKMMLPGPQATMNIPDDSTWFAQGPYVDGDATNSSPIPWAEVCRHNADCPAKWKEQQSTRTPKPPFFH